MTKYRRSLVPVRDSGCRFIMNKQSRYTDKDWLADIANVKAFRSVPRWFSAFFSASRLKDPAGPAEGGRR